LIHFWLFNCTFNCIQWIMSSSTSRLTRIVYIMNMQIFAIIILYYGFFDMFNVWRGLNPVAETCNLCINWVFIYFSFFIFYYIFFQFYFFLFVIYSFNYMTWFLKKCVDSYFALYLLLFILYRKNPSIY